jgi:hypothetical protein
VKALRCTIQIAAAAGFVGVGLALGGFSGSVLMLMAAAAFLSAVA